MDSWRAFSAAGLHRSGIERRDRETGWICRLRLERWKNAPTGQLGDHSIVTVVANTPTPRYERSQNHASR